jgi:hypothetical protein
MNGQLSSPDGVDALSNRVKASLLDSVIDRTAAQTARE